MSDDQESTLKRSKLAVLSRDFVRFLQAKGPDSNCPVCGCDQWTVITMGPEGYAYRMVAPLRDGDRPISISTFAIHCEDCGYVQQHASKVVKKWVEANPAEPELDFDPAPDDEGNSGE